MNLKQILGQKIAEKVKSGQCIGIGTGSTAEEAIKAIGQRIKSESLKITGVSSSVISTTLALEVGIHILPLGGDIALDWGFDGADEVAEDSSMLKGRGGAMLKEKIISSVLPEWVIAITEDKLVKKIGDSCSLPVEVIPQSRSLVESNLKKLGVIDIIVRTGTNFYGPLFTENGNIILDVKFPVLDKGIASEVKALTGVVEHGFFPAESKNKILVVRPNQETYWFS